MPKFKTTIEVEIEVEYTVDEEIRQGADARFPSTPEVEDFTYEFPLDLDCGSMAQLKEECDNHLISLEKEWDNE